MGEADQIRPVNILIRLVVALLLAQSCLCQQFSIEDDYLNLAKADQLNEPYHQQVRRALLALKVGPNARAFQVVRRVWQMELEHTEHQEMYRTLAQLEIDSGHCQTQLINLVKSILAQIRAQPKGEIATNYGHFITYYAKHKFTQCAFDIVTVTKNYREWTLLDDFDQLFAAALNLKARMRADKDDETSYYHKLATLLMATDLASAELNVAKMQKVARRHKLKPAQPEENPFSVFMANKCRRLGETFQPMLDMINLAKLLGQREIVFARVNRLNEYHRLCLAWAKPENRHRIEANIERRATQEVGCSGGCF